MTPRTMLISSSGIFSVKKPDAEKKVETKGSWNQHASFNYIPPKPDFRLVIQRWNRVRFSSFWMTVMMLLQSQILWNICSFTEDLILYWSSGFCAYTSLVVLGPFVWLSRDLKPDHAAAWQRFFSFMFLRF